MDRRELLGVMGAGAAGLVAMGGTARADHEHSGQTKIMNDCATACNEAAHHCLGELAKGGSGHAAHHAKAHEAAMDCQEFCKLAATLMARTSPMAKYAHEACADACRDCATACEGQSDPVMTACIKSCLECEKACRHMSAGH